MRSAIIETVDRRAGKQASSWLAALATAILATQALSFAEVVDVSESIYLTSSITWLAVIVGGLTFGLGMVLTRGCGGRHLVLAAGGNLRSWIVLSALGLTAYMTLRGILALPRTWIEGLASVPADPGAASLGSIAAAQIGVGVPTASLAIALLAALVCLICIARIKSDRGRALPVISGIIIGLLIAGGWYVTNVLGFDDFEPVRTESVTFTAPVGNAIQYLLTYTGSQADFGITVVAGTLAGAFLAALARGGFNLEGFDTPHHLLRYAAGGAMMGFGGILALGCTIGAGLSGVSTLSIISVIALISIVVGGTVGHSIKTNVFGGRAPETQPAE